jgi:hypothetical protein
MTARSATTTRLSAPRSRQYCLWCFPLLATLYTGAKELSYPMRRHSQSPGRSPSATGPRSSASRKAWRLGRWVV